MTDWGVGGGGRIYILVLLSYYRSSHIIILSFLPYTFSLRISSRVWVGEGRSCVSRAGCGFDVNGSCKEIEDDTVVVRVRSSDIQVWTVHW